MLEDIDRRKAAAILLAFFILGGLIAAIPQGYSVKTEMYCPCDINEGDVPCNNITQVNYLFYTGLINVFHQQDMKEIVECRDGNRTGTHNRLDNQDYGIEVLSARIL